MEYAAWKFWFDVVQTLAMIALTLWIWQSDRRAARRSEVDEKLAQLGNRVTIVEQRLVATPDHNDLGKVYARLDDVSGELKGLHGEFTAMRRVLELIHQHLLNTGIRP